MCWKPCFLNGHSVCYHKLCFTYDITFYFNFILNNIYSGWFEWGLDEKKKTTQKTKTDLKKLEQLSLAKALGAQFGLDLKCLFRPNPNLFKSCSLLRARRSVFQILAPLNLKEPWFLVVRASGRRSKSLWRVLYEWISRTWLNSLSKYAGARP